MYSALEVARYIIKRCNESNYSISNLKLQKILYFLQAQFLVEFDTPCFNETIEAWDFGPVVPYVYHKYAVFGAATIPYIDDKGAFSFSEEDWETIDAVTCTCAPYSAAGLTKITQHQRPWVNAYGNPASDEITHDSLREYFSEE